MMREDVERCVSTTASRELSPRLVTRRIAPTRVMSEKPFYAPDRGPRPPRQPTAGEEVWRLRHGDRVQSCELRNADRDGAGWDVIVREQDELLFSRRCVDEPGARFVADSFNQFRTGWNTEPGK
jgi:hypothetical protein